MNARFTASLLAASFVASLNVTAPAASAAMPRMPALAAPLAPFLTSARSRREFSPSERGVAADVAVLRDGRMLRRATASTPIRIGVLLKAQHEDELRALVLAQGERTSAYYRRFLSAPQFKSYFAPTAATVARTEMRLRLAGFRIERTNANRTMIVATAPASAAGRYFHTSFALVQQTGSPVTYANLAPAIMPAEIKDDVVSVSGLHSFRTMRFNNEHETAAARAARRAAQRSRVGVARGPQLQTRPLNVALASPSPDPRPISVTTAAPGPNATDMVETPASDMNLLGDVEEGYGPPIFAEAYDFPTQHGYNGQGRAAGSVINADYSENDLKTELTQFKLPARTPGVNEFRVCYDGTAASLTSVSCKTCMDTGSAGTSTNCDTDGESGLDAEAIMSEAPGAAFYEYLAPAFSDLELEEAYESVVSQNVVDAVNSSFGGCETDDPGFQYSSDYIALEGSAEGITFSASTGDTGALSCGLYATNGAPQTLVNVSSPAADEFFTGVGGSSFAPIVTGVSVNDYTKEQAWGESGGGSSVLIAQPAWQTPAVTAANAAVGSTDMDITTGRDIPDISFTADAGAGFGVVTEGGNGLIICSEAASGSNPCAFSGSGGTSLSSPLFVALQTEINQITKGRNGFVNPRLYAISLAHPGFAFRDITVGNNNLYNAGTGYDMATGLGSPLGFELAAAE